MTQSPRDPHFAPSRRRFLLGASAAVLALTAGLGGHANGAMNVGAMRAAMRERFGPPGLEVLDAWLRLLRDLENQDLPRQLKGVNDFFNRRVRWVEDIHSWKQTDYWATPLETLGKGEGDCEDYSIAKYQTLRKLGIANHRLRMIYVRARIGRSGDSIAHMVLGHYAVPHGEPLILDNLIPTIMPASQRDDLTPVFAFNSNGLWAGDTSHSLADPTQRLSRWRSVLQRMTAEGFL